MTTENFFFQRTPLRVELEIIVTALQKDDSLLYWLCRHDITDNGADPDRLVRYFLSENGPDCPSVPWDNCIVHSTSWRYEDNRVVVLTYLVYADHAVLPPERSRTLSLSATNGPKQENLTRPRPHHLDESHVVLHGIRHLSQQIRRNSNMQRVLSPASLRCFRNMQEETAGRIHSKSRDMSGTFAAGTAGNDAFAHSITFGR